MSNSRSKRMVLAAQSLNSQPLEVTSNDLTNPDNLLFQSNQFPDCYDDPIIASDFNFAQSTHTHSPLLSNNQILENTIPEEAQSYVEVTNQHELENSPSILDQQEPQLPNNSINITEESQIGLIIITNDEETTTNNIEFEYIDQYVDEEEFDVDNTVPDDSTVTITEPTSSLSNNVARLVEYSDSSDSELDEPAPKRKKRCQVKKEEWNVEKNRLNREKGNEYLGKRKESGQWIKDIKKPKKEIKPRCKCAAQNNGVMKCHIITEEDRKLLFERFWAMDWGEKKVFIKCLIRVMSIKRKRDRKDPNTSKRKYSMVYHLKKGDDMIRVCKSLFLNTFAINNFLCWSWKSEDTVRTSENNPEPAPQTAQIQTTSTEKEFLNKFLEEMPKLPSHYCRQRTTLQYLQPDIISKQQFYKLYKEECITKNVKPLSIATFSNTLTLKKISLFKPKKDLCETCNGYVLGHISDEVYNEHIQKKIEAREEKDADKKNKKFVFTADLQAVLMAPRSNVSSNYYKTKLCVHNWCIYDLKSAEGYCFLWNEAEGGLTSEEFATIMSKFIAEKVIPKIDEHDREIIFFTDGCTYQNRNSILSNAMTNIAMYNNVTITQKYLEVGHTQMEVDSMHAMIEKRLKNQTINVPAEYLYVCRTAKSNNKRYECKYITFGYFKDFKQDVTFYKSIRPGKMKGDPKVTDLRAIQYRPNGEIYYKLRFKEDWKLLNQRRNPAKPVPVDDLKKLYEERRKITKKKYDDLQQLKSSMPLDYQGYFDALPHDS